MRDDGSVSRRRFLLFASSMAAAVSGGLFGGCARRFQPARALTDSQRRMVEALADQIIPPDQDAGGRDAGVADFIDVQLRGPYKRHLSAYQAGLVRLEQTSLLTRKRPFLELPFDEQTVLLGEIEADQVPPGVWQKGEAGEFFRLICDHCLQGYYGSPRHGGNRSGCSWRMLKLDYPQVAGRSVV